MMPRQKVYKSGDFGGGPGLLRIEGREIQG
jgi:hypothetical protein